MNRHDWRARLEAPPYPAFASAVAAERFGEAEAVAAGMLGEGGSGRAFWMTQLGYACFLNEQDAEARYERAPAHFEELVAQWPDDDNALFWKAYLDLVVLGDDDRAREELRQVILLSPRHPYAPLVLGGMAGDADEAIGHLRAALRITPNSLRALRDLGRLLEQQRRPAEARAVFRSLLDADPFVETRFGIMDRYINEVLTGAAHAERWKAGARRSLAASGDGGAG